MNDFSGKKLNDLEGDRTEFSVDEEVKGGSLSRDVQRSSATSEANKEESSIVKWLKRATECIFG